MGNATFSEAYEQMRCQVLTASPGGGCFGLSVLLREGVAAWIEHCAAIRLSSLPTGPATQTCPAITSPLHAGMVQILASIALNRIQEIHS
jgi:hypothetical protein